jgi:hypothetical protein
MLTVDNKVYSFPVLRHPSQYDSAAGQFPVIAWTSQKV